MSLLRATEIPRRLPPREERRGSRGVVRGQEIATVRGAPEPLER